MDWQRVKERVTEEVLRQLQEEQETANPERVQKLVLQALHGVPSTPAPGHGIAPAAPTPSSHPLLPTCDVTEGFKTDILVVVAGPVCSKVEATIKLLARESKVSVVAGEYSSRLAEVQACGQLHCSGNESLARRLAQGAGLIVVPVITTGTAAKVGSLIGDCLPSTVLVQAALFGRRIIMARDEMAVPAHAAWSIRRKVEEVMGNLRTLGITITDLATITAEAGKATGLTKLDTIARTGGFIPAYQPHPAVLASQLARAEALTARSMKPSPAVPDYDQALARMIDHTLLKPDSTADQIAKLCKEAIEYNFCSVCVNPTWVPLCARLLKNTQVKVCTVVGFPLGATSSVAKALEASEVIQKGATEVDMVLNVGALKSGQHEAVLEDIQNVVRAAKGKALVKVILETGLLTDEEKVRACELAKQAGVDFVKTSTGFGPGGATVDDIALMRKVVGPTLGVKASGGIRDYESAQAMVRAGANRIGASASVNIVKRAKVQTTKEKY